MANVITPRIGIVILQYGNTSLTLDCVDSLLGEVNNYYSVIIVDNDTPEDDNFPLVADSIMFSLIHKDKQKSVYKDEDKKLYLIKNDTNTGYSSGNNLGIEFAFGTLDCDYVWILNNDTIADSSSCNELLNYIIQYPNKRIIGHTVVSHGDEKVQALCGMVNNPILGTGRGVAEGSNLNGVKALSEEQVVERVDYVYGASFVIKRNIVLGEVFDKSFFLYFEELDLYKRAKIDSGQVGWSKNVIIYHKGSSTINPAGKSELSEFHSTRSYLIYTYRHHRRSFYLYSSIRTSGKLTRYILRGNTRLIKAHLRGIGAFYRWIKGEQHCYGEVR